jgi:hypothetical protein
MQSIHLWRKKIVTDTKFIILFVMTYLTIIQQEMQGVYPAACGDLTIRAKMAIMKIQVAPRLR